MPSQTIVRWECSECGRLPTEHGCRPSLPETPCHGQLAHRLYVAEDALLSDEAIKALRMARPLDQGGDAWRTSMQAAINAAREAQ